jgi:CheY-like chemotaxis protein
VKIFINDKIDHQFIDILNSSIKGFNMLQSSIKEKKHICPSILIADDEPFNIFTLGSMLSWLGASSEGAQNGEECMKKIKEMANKKCNCRGFVALFLDINMPKINGFQVARQIQEMIREGSI